MKELLSKLFDLREAERKKEMEHLEKELKRLKEMIGNGPSFTTHHGLYKFPTEAEWQKVLDARGDISVIVPDIKKDQPVEHFDNSLVR